MHYVDKAPLSEVCFFVWVALHYRRIISNKYSLTQTKKQRNKKQTNKQTNNNNNNNDKKKKKNFTCLSKSGWQTSGVRNF